MSVTVLRVMGLLDARVGSLFSLALMFYAVNPVVRVFGSI